ncbi:MAG: hypothetical protein NTW49_10675 [Bacteroidia bacterium]|nr:hypothetical protein [Bacteroidia bacterium]
MDKLALKSKLKAKAADLQKTRMDILQNAIEEAQQSANEYGPPKDRYDSYRMQLLRKKEMLGKQYLKAASEFVALETISTIKEMNRVDFGAVVITNDQKLFISIGVGKIETENEVYFAISPNVPIFHAVKGLKKGDNFEFRGKTNLIIDVF